MPRFKDNDGLILPSRTGKITRHHTFTAESVALWRRQHVHSDKTTTAQDLYVLLQDMNQTPLSAKVRFEILLILKPHLALLCDDLQKLYYRQEILSENLKAIADLVYALNFEMVTGYKLVIHDTLQAFFVRKKLLVAALANAMHFCIRILFHSFEQHRYPPPDSWYELHSLYLFGIKHKLLKKPINHQFSHSRFENIDEMYKHCLLFAIANPHRLRKEELSHLIYAMDAWAPLLELININKSEKPFLFIVDLENDIGPKYSLIYPEPTEFCYYLNMHAITEHLIKLVEYQRSQTITPSKSEESFSPSELSLPKPFVESLLRSWQQMEEREYHREMARGFSSITIGIPSCFHYLDKALQDSNVVPISEATPILIPQTHLHTEKEHTAYPVYTCELTDKSEKGYGLKWLQKIPPQLVCGEIIGIEREEGWEIGTIRWLKHENDNALLFGVQLLSKHAVPIKARSSLQHAMVRTLLIPAVNPQESHATDMLITPTVPFKAGQTLTLYYAGKNYEAKLEKNVAQTPSYQLFAIRYIGIPLKLPQTFFEDKDTYSANQS